MLFRSPPPNNLQYSRRLHHPPGLCRATTPGAAFQHSVALRPAGDNPSFAFTSDSSFYLHTYLRLVRQWMEYGNLRASFQRSNLQSLCSRRSRVSWPLTCPVFVVKGQESALSALPFMQDVAEGLVLFTSRLEPSPDLDSSGLGSRHPGIKDSSPVRT